MNDYYKNLESLHRKYASTPRVILSDMSLLYPPFRTRAEATIQDANKIGITYIVYETLRTDNRQMWLFTSGKSKIKKRGMHGCGVALDAVPLNDKGKPWWPEDEKYWRPLWDAATAHGLYAFGKPKSEGGQGWDSAHIQAVSVKLQPQIMRGDYPWEGEA